MMVSAKMAAIAKQAPPLIAPVAAGMTLNLWWLPVILFGTALGIMARAGRMLSKQKSWDDVKKDAIVSLLIGGMNMLLAASIISWFELDYLKGMVVAALCAFGGVQTLESSMRWALKHWVADNIKDDKK